MPNILVIDWGRKQLRAALVESAGDDVRIANVASAPRGDTTGALAEMLGAMGLAKGSYSRVLVSLSGDLVQFRRLRLPPGPEDELAPMVALQAEREFGVGEEGAAIDFIPVHGDLTTPHDVVVARLAKSEGVAIAAACSLAGVKPDRWVLRPASAAALATRVNPALASGAYLLALPGGGAIELVLWEDGLPTLVRRAPTTASGTVSQGELRRTVSSARIQLGDRPLDGVMFCGCEPVATQTDPPLESAYQDVGQWITSRTDRTIEEAAQFAGAVGAAVLELAGEAPAIDLLNPRSAETEAPNRRPQILAIAAAAMLLLGGAWLGYARFTQYDAETAAVASELATLNQEIEKFAPFRAKADAIEQWRATDVTWLNEFERLSRKLRPQPLDSKEFPVETDVLITGLTATVRSGANESGGQIDLKGAARAADALDDVEQELRDAWRQVQPGAVASLDTPGPYGTLFQATLTSPPVTLVDALPDDGGKP